VDIAHQPPHYGSRAMANGTSGIDYGYTHGAATWNDRALWDVVRSELAAVGSSARVFELGCGNGVMAARMAALGYAVTAVDPSESGIEVARRTHPGVDFHVGSAEDDLAARFGRFPVLVSIEVIEHCYSPARFAAVAQDLLEPNGLAIVSTPYHGYLKNLAIALSGRMDAHFGALWEGGHIKFFSIATLSALFEQCGFGELRVRRVGRIPPLAKSMILIAKRR
jgi:2-polyprenyl-6-hydroxyphenyl methylase/3-demethylubiquinone-9 3-methyltransferase